MSRGVVALMLLLLLSLGCAPSFTVQVGTDAPCEPAEAASDPAEEACVVDFGNVLAGLSTDRRVVFTGGAADTMVELDLRGSPAFRMGARALRDGGFVSVACIPEGPGPLEGTLVVLMDDAVDVEIGITALAQ